MNWEPELIIPRIRCQSSRSTTAHINKDRFIEHNSCSNSLFEQSQSSDVVCRYTVCMWAWGSCILDSLPCGQQLINTRTYASYGSMGLNLGYYLLTQVETHRAIRDMKFSMKFLHSIRASKSCFSCSSLIAAWNSYWTPPCVVWRWRLTISAFKFSNTEMFRTD